MSAKQVLSAIPWPVYVGAGVLAALYLIGRKSGAQGGVAETIGAGVGSVIGGVATGAVKGAASGAGRAAGAVIQAPADIVNGAGAQLSGDSNWTLGGWIYDLTHPKYDPNKGFVQDQQRLREGVKNTDALWGPVGGVSLRTQ